jgi:hypothetical protein
MLLLSRIAFKRNAMPVSNGVVSSVFGAIEGLRSVLINGDVVEASKGREIEGNSHVEHYRQQMDG